MSQPRWMGTPRTSAIGAVGAAGRVLGIPTYAVLGNHDYASGNASRLRDGLEAAGVVVLRNEAVPIDRAGGSEPLYLVGVGPYRLGLSRPATAVDDIPEDAARIVVMHNPASSSRSGHISDS